MNDIVAIVTPIGNEIDHIAKMYEELQKVPYDLWITVFDSFCADGSEGVVRNWSRNNPRIVVTNIGNSIGVAAAYTNGIKKALKLNATKIIEVDVGHPVSLIPLFVEHLNKVPVVMGTRFGNGKFVNVKWKRKLLSICGTIVARWMLNLPFSDCTSGLQGLTAEAAKKLPLDEFLSKKHFYQTEFKFYCKSLPFAEIPFTYVGTPSSLSSSAIKEALSVLFRLFGQCDQHSLSGNCMPIPDDSNELLVSIKEDLEILLHNKSHIVSYHLQEVLGRLLTKIIKLIERETTK